MCSEVNMPPYSAEEIRLINELSAVLSGTEDGKIPPPPAPDDYNVKGKYDTKIIFALLNTVKAKLLLLIKESKRVQSKNPEAIKRVQQFEKMLEDWQATSNTSVLKYHNSLQSERGEAPTPGAALKTPFFQTKDFLWFVASQAQAFVALEEAVSLQQAREKLSSLSSTPHERGEPKDTVGTRKTPAPPLTFDDDTNFKTRKEKEREAAALKETSPSKDTTADKETSTTEGQTPITRRLSNLFGKGKRL